MASWLSSKPLDARIVFWLTVLFSVIVVFFGMVHGYVSYESWKVKNLGVNTCAAHGYELQSIRSEEYPDDLGVYEITCFAVEGINVTLGNGGGVREEPWVFTYVVKK